MDTKENASDVDVDKLVRVYIKMREAHSLMASEFKKQEDSIKEKMAVVKTALLDYCKEQNLESVRTNSGVFFRTIKTSYWTNDWESMGKFVVEHQAPELYEKRLHQGNIKQFLEEHPELLPPGLNVDSEYSVTVRRK
jgi:hypothetical protein|tara:strand:+ start:2556 stop:2966 length:411 start_codon:yes stop_codon:yes gene_type:complete